MSGLRDILEAATPGSWRASIYDTVEEARVFGDGGAEGDLVAFCDGRRDLRYEANAHLIARAPELAALVLDMGEFIRNVCDTTNEWESSLLARLDQLGKEQTDG